VPGSTVTTAVAARIPNDDADRLRLIAENDQRTVSEVLRDFIAERLRDERREVAA
jgi:predicted DNA-binding protein